MCCSFASKHRQLFSIVNDLIDDVQRLSTTLDVPVSPSDGVSNIVFPVQRDSRVLRSQARVAGNQRDKCERADPPFLVSSVRSP